MKLVIRGDRINNDSRRLSNGIALMVFLINLTNCAYVIEPLIGIPQSLISDICKGILLLFLVTCIPAVIRNFPKRIIIYGVSVFFAFIVSCLVNSHNRFLMPTITNHVILVLPIVVLICCIKDYGTLLSSLTIVSYLVICLSFLTMLMNIKSFSGYRMGLANSITLPVVMMLYNFYKDRTLISLLMAVIGTLVIFIMGSRGALLGIICFILIILLRGCRTKKNKNICIFSLSIITLTGIFFKPILKFVAKIFDELGLSSRTLWLFLNDIGHDSGRSVIYGKIINSIKLSPFHMHGIAGEYAITGNGYAHNFILELLIDFGVVIGGWIIIYIMLKAVNTVIDVIRDESEFNITRFIFFAVSFPIALLSGTIWTETYFWMWLLMSERLCSYFDE